MYALRFFLVSALFALPFFVFAQTYTSTPEQPTQTATTTAEQPVFNLKEEVDRITRELLNAAPTPEEIRSKAIRDYLSIITTPSNPGPNETVIISIESYLADLNKASIRWVLNGKTVLSGTGRKKFSFQNGNSGEITRLTVSITTTGGESITKDFSWTPVGVTIFWEADTYTPPFYRGKPLLSPQAIVNVVATPDNTSSQSALSAGNLVYTWEKNGAVSSDASGYGKNSFSFVGPKPYDLVKVRVRASSVDDTVNSETSVSLPLFNPFVLFYEKNPLSGVLYNKPLGSTVNLTNKEFSISAEPYFFSNERADTPTINYGWYINGKEALNEGRDITLRNDTLAKGTSEVSLAVRGIKQTFQTASQNLRIDFTEGNPMDRPTF